MHCGIVHEWLIEYVRATELDAASLTDNILQVISQMQLNTAVCVSAAMEHIRGSSSSVSAWIRELNPKAVYSLLCSLLESSIG